MFVFLFVTVCMFAPVHQYLAHLSGGEGSSGGSCNVIARLCNVCTRNCICVCVFIDFFLHIVQID